MSSKKEQDGSEDSTDNKNDKDSTDSENDEGSSESNEGSEMTKEELHRKVREHMERRREAYEKMGSVDKPR